MLVPQSFLEKYPRAGSLADTISHVSSHQAKPARALDVVGSKAADNQNLTCVVRTWPLLPHISFVTPVQFVMVFCEVLLISLDYDSTSFGLQFLCFPLTSPIS